MSFTKEFNNFKQYSAEYTFFFYRKIHLNNSRSITISFIYGIAKLIFAINMETFHVAFNFFKKKPQSKNKLCILIGSKNNYNAYLRIKSYLPNHDIYGFHTYHDFCSGRISLLIPYITGINSIKSALCYSFLKKGILRNIVLKKIDWYVLSNGQFSKKLIHEFKQYENVIYFSEYSAYIKKILQIFIENNARIIYFPHARIPNKHPRFWADILISPDDKHIELLKENAKLFYLKNLKFKTNAGLKFPFSSKDNEITLIYCTNALNGILSTLKNILLIKSAFSKENKNHIITIFIRPHPAEKFISLKKLTYKIILNAKLDSYELISSLEKADFIYAGMSGVVFDALMQNKYVFTDVNPNTLMEYYSRENISDLKTFDYFIKNIKSNFFICNFIKNRTNVQHCKSVEDIEDIEVKRVMSKIFFFNSN